jgi:peptide methionine sulfoxide reductase msrA/msrB
MKNLLYFTLLSVAITLFPQLTSATERTAYFGGGCFWCTEADFAKIEGVRDVVSGYMGGHVVNPAYKEVSKGTTGHYEIVKVVFDDQKVNFQNLLHAFWRMIDPTDEDGSFCDRGQQYSSVVFYDSDRQKMETEKSVVALNMSGKFLRPVATKVLAAETFYPAEEYHQDYSKKNPIRYKFYRSRCGRDNFINQYWGGDTQVYK